MLAICNGFDSGRIVFGLDSWATAAAAEGLFIKDVGAVALPGETKPGNPDE